VFFEQDDSMAVLTHSVLFEQDDNFLFLPRLPLIQRLETAEFGIPSPFALAKVYGGGGESKFPSSLEETMAQCEASCKECVFCIVVRRVGVLNCDLVLSETVCKCK